MTLTLAPVDGQILKRDAAVRLRTPRDRRDAILKEFDQSGMSGQKFAKWAGIKHTTFANWLQLRRKQGVKVVSPAKSLREPKRQRRCGGWKPWWEIVHDKSRA